MANKIQLSKKREFDITITGDTYAGIHAMPYVTAALRSPDTVAKGYVRILDGLTHDNLTVNDREHYNLSILSPKYVEIYNNIQISPGLVMCYSQFRTVEGIEVFRRVLEAHGYYQCEPGDVTIKKIEIGKTMTRVCLDKKSGHLDIEDSEEIWATVKPVQRHPILSNYLGYRKSDLSENLIKSLAMNGVTEKIINKVTFKPTRNIAQIQTTIEAIFKKLSDSFHRDLPESEPKPSDAGSLVDELIWVKEIDPVTGDRNIYPAQYGIFTKKYAEEILEIQGSDDNKYGQHMHILFITMAGAEGLSLRNIRTVNIMEPFWNMVKINQVIGRARRNFSHQSLPLDNRNVRIYEYIGTFSPEQLSGTWSSSVSYDELFSDKDRDDKDGKTSKSSKGQEVSEEVKQRDIRQMAQQYSGDIANIDDNITSDQMLLEISKRKDNIMNGFLKLIKESAIDCHSNKLENIQGDPLSENMICERSSNFPSSNPLGSETKFIKIPGKLIQGSTVTSKHTDLPTGKHLISIPLNNKLGKFSISAILDGDQGIIYDLYYYYGLDPTLKGPTRIYRPIGIANNNDGYLNVSLNDGFFSDEYLETLERYNNIEKVRIQLENLETNPFIGLPKTPEREIQWIRAIRKDSSLAKYKQLSVSDSAYPTGVPTSSLTAPTKSEGDEEVATVDTAATSKLSPYQILGVDPSITPQLLSDLVKKGDLDQRQKKAIQEILRERRRQKKK